VRVWVFGCVFVLCVCVCVCVCVSVAFVADTVKPKTKLSSNKKWRFVLH
jgi:hypothetical protein